MRFKIDWASLIVRKKFTVFALFCFVFKGKLEGLIHGGAYFRNFTVIINHFNNDWPLKCQCGNIIQFPLALP